MTRPQKPHWNWEVIFFQAGPAHLVPTAYIDLALSLDFPVTSVRKYLFCFKLIWVVFIYFLLYKKLDTSPFQLVKGNEWMLFQGWPLRLRAAAIVIFCSDFPFYWRMCPNFYSAGLQGPSTPFYITLSLPFQENSGEFTHQVQFSTYWKCLDHFCRKACQFKSRWTGTLFLKQCLTKISKVDCHQFLQPFDLVPVTA